MGAAPSPSEKLRRLEQILAGLQLPRVEVTGDEHDAALRQLESVPFERIVPLTELPGSRDRDDDVAAVEVRLLPNDYAAAVRDLRVFVAKAGERVDAAAPLLCDVRKFLWRATKATSRGGNAVGDLAPDATPAEPAPAPPT